MRPTTLLALLAVTAALLAGCGGSSGAGSTATGPPEESSPKAPAGASAQSCDTGTPSAEALRVTGISCQLGRRVLHGWQRDPACSSPSGASRSSCTAASYRCLGTVTGRGVAVSCARPGRSIAFLATEPRRDPS